MRREGWKGWEERKIEGKKLRKVWKEGINQEIKMEGCEEGWKEEMTKGTEKGIGEPNFTFEGENIENKKALLFVTV